MLYEQPVYRHSTGWQWLQLSLTNPDRSSFSIVLYPVILWYYIHCISQWIGLSIVETYYIMFEHGNISFFIFYLGHTSQLNKLKRHETLFWQTVQKEVNVITQILRREKLHLISHRTQFSLHFSLLPLLPLLPRCLLQNSLSSISTSLTLLWQLEIQSRSYVIKPIFNGKDKPHIFRSKNYDLFWKDMALVFPSDSRADFLWICKTCKLWLINSLIRKVFLHHMILSDFPLTFSTMRSQSCLSRLVTDEVG